MTFRLQLRAGLSVLDHGAVLLLDPWALHRERFVSLSDIRTLTSPRSSYGTAGVSPAFEFLARSASSLQCQMINLK